MLIFPRSSSIQFIVIICAILCLTAGFTYAQQTPSKGVLILYWYNKDYPWNVKFDHTFQAALRSGSATQVDYYSEYLETNRFPGLNQSLLLRDYLKQKYADRSIDVLVAASDASLEFLINNRAELFPKSPIVFVASRYPTPQELSFEPGLTGIVNLSAHEKTVDLALKLHPRTKHVYVVSGTLDHDKRLETLAREDLRGLENRTQISYLTDLPPHDLIARVRDIPEDSIVLYVWQQSKNAQGALLESPEVFASIAASTKVPLYGMTLPLIGAGAVGGYINTAEGIGTKAGQIALQILNGAKAQEIPIELAPAVPMFDWRQVQHWNIREGQLPSESVILFKEVSLWDQHKGTILAALALILGQAGLIAWLLAERRNRRKSEEARRHLAAIVESSNDAIIGTTLDGEILSWNDGAESLYGFSATEVLGRNVSMVVPPERWDEFTESMKCRAKGERIEHFETVRMKRDGNRVDVSVSVSPIKDDRGKVIAAATITRDVSDRKRAEKELQHLTGRLIHLQDEERRRIAGELHDSLGQSLVIIKNRAMICLRDTRSVERVTEQLEEISSTATSAIDEVHEIAHNLRPYELDRLGLVKAVQTMVNKLAKLSSIEFSTDLDPIDGLLSREAETSVYRIIQEGLNNVVKHAGATQGTVSLKRTPDQLVIYVSDNGKGISNHHDESENGHGLGLAGVAERARMLGGSSSIRSDSQTGTKMVVTVHLPEAHAQLN